MLQWLGLVLQPALTGAASQVHPVRRGVAKILRALRATPPASLGTPFEKE